MRILTALLVTALATAGCGGPDEAKRSAPVSPSPSAAAVIDADAAAAAATATLLVVGDVPGATATPAEAPDARDAALEDKTDACVGITPIDYLAEQQSPSFVVGGFPNALQLGSEATVAPTAAAATAEFAAYASPKAPGCFSTFLKESLADLDEPGVTFDLGEVTPRPTALPPGASAVLAFEFTATLKGEGITLPVKGVVAAALVGQIAVTVQSSGFGTSATSAGADVDRLLGIVTKRAAAAASAA